MKNLRYLFLGIFGLLIFLSAGRTYVFAEDAKGDVYYTKVNIWYEEPDKIFSTNYHKGAIIPLGSKVSEFKIKGETIQFAIDDIKGVNFTIINIKKHSNMDTKELFGQYFSKENPKALLGKLFAFSELEKKNIKNGEIAPGMSKDAVIMSYGYPPKHKTPDLKSDIWYYWSSRFVAEQLIFKDNRLKEIERSVKMRK
jgi:hypothetical protein